MGFELLND